MTDNEIKKALKEHIERTETIKYGVKKTTYVNAELLKDTLDLINRLQAENEALIAGQETMSKCIEEQQAEIETQSQNFKVLVSDHRCLQRSFDNLKGLYQAKKEKVESAKSKSIYFAKELQKARAETNRVTALAAEWKDAAYTYADNIDKIKAEAIKDFAERVKAKSLNSYRFDYKKNISIQKKIVNTEDIDELVKEMVGDTE